MAKKEVTPRQISERARRQAMPLAKVIRPLRFVLNREGSWVNDSRGNKTWELNSVGKLIKRLAAQGQGQYAADAARRLAGS